MKRIVERITLVIIVLIMFTNTCFAAEGYSEEVTTNSTVTSMPANTTKGLFYRYHYYISINKLKLRTKKQPYEH